MNSIFEVYSNVYRTALFQRPNSHVASKQKPETPDPRTKK